MLHDVCVSNLPYHVRYLHNICEILQVVKDWFHLIFRSRIVFISSIIAFKSTRVIVMYMNRALTLYM